MAVKISELPAVTTSVGLTAQFEVNNGGTSQACTPDQITTAGISNTAAPTIGFYSPSPDTIRTPNFVIIDDSVTAAAAVVNTTGTQSLIQMADAATGSYSRIVMRGGSGKYAFAIGVQDLLNNKMSIAPSTATDGTTFTTAELEIAQAAGGSRWVNGVRIGADSTNNLLDDSTNGSGTTTLFIGNASINVTSDESMKPNREPTKRDALEIIRQIVVIDHDWKSDSVYAALNERGTFMGVGAHQIQPLTPWAVNVTPDLWYVEHIHLVPLLIKAVQQLTEQVEELKAKVPQG